MDETRPAPDLDSLDSRDFGHDRRDGMGAKYEIPGIGL